MTIQITIVVLYLVLTILIGLFTNRKKNKSDSKAYHGAGLGILMCIAVGAGEWLGGTSTSGVSEYGFVYGLSGSWYTIANALGIIFLALFFAKMFRKKKTITVPGLMDSYVGGKSRFVSSLIQIFILIVVGTSQLIAIGTIGEVLFGLDAMVSIALLDSAVLLYTVLGGMKAVGKTNIMHMLVMYFGVIAALVVCLISIGGIKTLHTNLPTSYFKFDQIGWNKISSWVIASVLGGCVAQAGLQPVLAAKDDKTAIFSSYITAIIVAPFGILTALLGMVARYQFPEMTNAKLALPTLLANMNPYLGGILIASILAAILSTASPIFLSCGTIFTRDIYEPMKKQTSEKGKIVTSKVSTLLAGILCIGLALVLYNMQKVLDIVYFAYGLRGSMFVVLLLGIYWKKVNPRWADIAILSTVAVGLFWVLWKQYQGHYPINHYLTDTYACIIVAFLFTFLGSLLFKKVDRKVLLTSGLDE